MIKNLNQGEVVSSIQILKLENIPEGEFSLNGKYFLVKNITDNNILAQVKMANSDKYINTILYPGWNVEILEGIKEVQPNTLQYGY